METNPLFERVPSQDLEKELAARKAAAERAARQLRMDRHRRRNALDADYEANRRFRTYWVITYRPWPDMDAEDVDQWEDEREARADATRRFRLECAEEKLNWDLSQVDWRGSPSSKELLALEPKRKRMMHTGWTIEERHLLGSKYKTPPASEDRMEGPCVVCGLPCRWSVIIMEYLHHDQSSPINADHPAWPELPEESTDARPA